MNELKIHRDGADRGPYTTDEARGLIASGELLGTDMAWHDALADWAPLRSLPEFSSLFSMSPASAVSIPPTDAQAHPGGVVLDRAGTRSGRDVRLVASLVDAWIYVLLEVAAGYLSFVPAWVPITLYIALQGVLLVKRGQTLGKLLQGIKIVDHRTKDRAGFAKVFLVRTGIQWAFVWIPAVFTLLSAALITGGEMGVASGLIILGVAGLVSSLLALFALIDMLFIYSADCRCLHDRMAGTSVVGARERILRDKIVYWIVISILLVAIVGAGVMIGNGAMSI